MDGGIVSSFCLNSREADRGTGDERRGGDPTRGQGAEPSMRWIRMDEMRIQIYTDGIVVDLWLFSLDFEIA